MSTTTIQERKRDETRTSRTDTETQTSDGSRTGAESQSNADSTRDSPQDDRALPRDLVFGLLSTERRRRLLRFLDENGGQTTLSEAAEQIAAAENGVDVKQVTTDQRKRVYVGLYQCHLPKMDDAGVIDYDQQRGTIELRDRADRLFPHLYLDPEEDVVVGSPSAMVRSTRLYDLSASLVDRLRR